MKSTRKNLVQLIAAASLAAATGFVYAQEAATSPASSDEPAAQQQEPVSGAQAAPSEDVGGTVAPAMGGTMSGGEQEQSAFPNEAPDTNTIDE